MENEQQNQNEYHPWLRAESGNDDPLLELLIERDKFIDNLVSKAGNGGAFYIMEDEDKDALASIYDRIIQRQLEIRQGKP